jgi:hypothetical protein
MSEKLAEYPSLPPDDIIELQRLAFRYFVDHSATSEGWHVQWESVPPGQESEPRSLGCIRGGNEADEANRQSRPWDGERVTGPQRK